jgi:arylsulfatase A-like enzyme
VVRIDLMSTRLFLLALALLGPLVGAEAKPNIIFIMADDLGFGDLGCYGQQVIRTPRLDKMAEEGMRFTQCYAGSTVCAPSRSVLMTGLHTGHTTVRGNMGKGGVKGLGGGNGRVPLRDADVTVAEVMKEAGYVTGMVGKWGLGEPGTTGEPNAQGFDDWFGFLNQRRAHNHYPDYLWRNREKVLLEGNDEGKETIYSHDRFTEFALGFIRGHAEEPFFLYLPYCVPHDEYQMPPDLEGNEERKSWSAAERSHVAMVERLDRDVGAILDLLTELKIEENTVVFFCSDNGAARRWEGFFDSSGSLRGGKRDMTEGGLRTPMIVRCPGVVPAGKVSEAVWSFADVLPTLADMGGGELPEGLDGVSVLPTLRGEEQELGERLLYWEFFERGFRQAVRWKDWKAIRTKEGMQLYDLSVDPGEKVNLATEQPEVLSVLEQKIGLARTPSRSWPVEGDSFVE